MIEVVVFAFNILLLMVVWEFFLKKTILDVNRDRLFDLRSYLRNEFAKRNALDSPAYKEVRQLLNAQIALTEKLSMFEYFLFANKVEKNKIVKEAIEQKTAFTYSTNDPELEQIIKRVRIQSSDICMEYMIFSSMVLTILVLVMGFFVAIYMVLKNFFINCKDMFTKAYRRSVYSQILDITASRFNLKQEIIEDASMFLIYEKT